MKSIGGTALFFVSFLALLVFSFYACYLFYLERVVDSTRPPLFGSDSQVVDALKKNEKGDSYKFLVLGDSRGEFPVEEELIRAVSKEIDFAVMLGDASDATASSHKYLRATMRRLNFNKPFFYVPGNNDFGKPAKRRYLKPFTKDDFIKTYGPLMFSFSYHGDLFIAICSVGVPDLENASVDFLKSFIPKRSKYRHCFVFMHIPASIPAFDNKKFTADDRYVTLFEKLKADYVFASHFHGYQATTYHGVNYIVTGGAGADLDGKRETQFYHAIEFMVTPDSISDRFVYSPDDVDLPDWLEIRSVLHVIPFFHAYSYIWYGILLIIGWVFFIYAIFRFKKSLMR